MKKQTKNQRFIEEVLGVSMDTQLACKILSEFNMQWHHGYQTGRGDGLVDAAKCVRQCKVVDPTLEKIAEAIEEL